MECFTISLDEELARQFDEVIAARGYGNRSEAVRDILRGPTAAVRRFADALMAERGVRHGGLNLVSVEMDSGRQHGHDHDHAHGDGHPYRNVHLKPRS